MYTLHPPKRCKYVRGLDQTLRETVEFGRIYRSVQRDFVKSCVPTNFVENVGDFFGIGLEQLIIIKTIRYDRIQRPEMLRKSSGPGRVTYRRAWWAPKSWNSLTILFVSTKSATVERGIVNSWLGPNPNFLDFGLDFRHFCVPEWISHTSRAQNVLETS